MRLRTIFAGMAFVLSIILPGLAINLGHMVEADAQSSFCQTDAVILGLRGSSQTIADDISGYPLFGAQAGSVAAALEGRLVLSGWEVDSLGINYDAVEAITTHIPPGPTYVDSVQTGVSLLKTQLAEIDNCQSGLHVVTLIGFSQGADVVKTTLWELEDAGVSYDHLIGAVILVGDPHFDPVEPISMIGSNDGKDGILDAWPLPSRYQNQAISLCVTDDWVCSANLNFDILSGAHESAYLGELADQAGILARVIVEPVIATRNTYRDSIVKWEGDSVTSWYVDATGHRHWIEDAETWNCLVESGSNVNTLSSAVLKHLPDDIGSHASCTSSGGGGSDPPVVTVSGYRLPYPEGSSHIVTQAPGGQFSHPCPGNSCQAIDFDMSLNDPISASTTGTVRAFSEDNSWSGGLGNHVMIEHTDGWCSLYAHLNSVENSISVGAVAVQGQVIGKAGETGLAIGVHLHFALVNCDSWQSVDVDFIEVADPIVGISYVSQNAYGTSSTLPGPTNEQWLRRNHRGEGHLDFNGDGDSDIFTANGSNWKVKYNGTGSWVTLASSSKTLDKLAFGDFNCDGVTDVFNGNSQFWQVSYGGTSEWTRINTSSIPTSHLAMVDVNGDGCTDVFRTTGSKWYISYGGTGSWQHVNTSSITLDQMILADMDKDGKTDAFRTTGSKWRISHGLNNSWVTINSSTVPFKYLAIGDFGGGSKDDVFRANGSNWKTSWAGTTGWKTLATSSAQLDRVLFGDLDGNGLTDVLRVYSGKWKVAYDGKGPWVVIGNSSADFSDMAG